MNDDINNTTICPAVGYQMIEMCVPVHVKPFAKIGDTITKCCGPATVMPGTDRCDAMPPVGECGFTITQRICIEVPVEFGADVDTGEVHGTCDQVSAIDICRNCPEVPPTVDE